MQTAQQSLLKTAFALFALSVLCRFVYAEDPVVLSPDKRYTLILRHLESEPIWPVIFLRDAHTGQESELFDYGSLGQGTNSILAEWSPNSHYVTLTIVSEVTTLVRVFRVTNGKIAEVEMLPLAKRLDKKKNSFRGGEFVDHWDDNRTLWIGDSSKDRHFRYRLTKGGKLLAVGFEDDSTAQ